MNIAIFTRWKNNKLLDLINDLSSQTEQFSLSIYSDSFFSDKWINVINTKNLNLSQKRNLAINSTNENDFLLMLDDDNRIFDKNFLVKLKNFYNQIKKPVKVISPVVYYRTTGKIQSAGVKFSYLFWKVFVNKKIKGDFWEVYWMWWNSLFWKWKDFRKAKFDEKIWYIREDLDYTYSLKEKWCKILVVNLKINHMEREKTLAEKSFVEGEIYKRKINNRDFFVKKHWNKYQKIVYWLFWRWVSMIWWEIKRFSSKMRI